MTASHWLGQLVKLAAISVALSACITGFIALIVTAVVQYVP